MTGHSTTTAARWVGAATIFMAISRIHLHFGFLLTLKAFTVANALAVLLLLGTASQWRPRDLKRHWMPKMIGFMFVVAIIGVPFALYPGRAFAFLHEAYGRTLIIGLICWAIARSPRGARFMARVIACAGLATLLLALHVNGVNTSGRLGGAYTYDPNDLSLIAVVTLPLVVWWITDRQSRFGKGMILSLPLIIWVIIRTDSRSGFLGLAAVGVGFLILSFKWAPPRIKKMGRMLLLGLLIAMFAAPGAYLQRVQSINDEDDYNRTSPTGRVEVWKRGMGYALDYPFLGVGIDNFNTAEGRSDIGRERAAYGIGWKWSAAHNSFLQATAELGLIGGLLFTILVLRTTYTLTLWYRDRKRIRGPPDLLPPFLGLSFLGYAVTGFFLSFAYYDILYVLLGLASAVMLNDKAVRQRKRPSRRRPVRRAVSRRGWEVVGQTSS